MTASIETMATNNIVSWFSTHTGRMKSNSKRHQDSEAHALFGPFLSSSLDFIVRISSARMSVGSSGGCPLLGGGTRGCQDASSCGETARTTAKHNTSLSPGAPGATAVRSGLSRRAADTHASPCRIVPLFVCVGKKNEATAFENLFSYSKKTGLYLPFFFPPQRKEACRTDAAETRVRSLKFKGHQPGRFYTGPPTCWCRPLLSSARGR